MNNQQRSLTVAAFFLLLSTQFACAQAPRATDYCQRLQQEIQGKKHGFLAGNLTYYVGGFHASWDVQEHETIGLTHPFHHDLRSRGVGLVRSRGKGADNTGLGNDFSGWEFYKDTRVLYGSVVIDGKVHRHPVPTKMHWRPDRMICQYEVDGVQLMEQKFISASDAACTIVTSSQPVTLRFDGRSFFGRHSVTSTASAKYDSNHNAIHLVEGGTTKCLPETDRSPRVGPVVYQGMSTVLAASRDFAKNHRFTKGDHGEIQYEFDVPCDDKGTVLAWAMHDDGPTAIENARTLIGGAGSDAARDVFAARDALEAKKRDMNRQLNKQIPYFRCSDPKFVDIYYYLWSLYLMYYIDVQKGWETTPHTQTAVNNFLGMHRYDATFQIKVGAWTANKDRYAHGNVLTWKPLFTNGHYRKSANGTVSLADNKGTTWHSGVYGNELSEHVLGAWQVYQHTGDVDFLRECYEGYYREAFWQQISPFFSNHFEVAESLAEMARLTGHEADVPHWNDLVPQTPDRVRAWFDQRWEAHGHKDYFGGPANAMLMTTGFWHMRSKHFPRSYAVRMTDAWALDSEHGFYGDYFPLAMSRQSMKKFNTQDDNAFGYTPDTAYFTLSGLLRQRLCGPASRLTVNHLRNYNFNKEWNVPVAPEAYRRDGTLFGDQYSNFNAGKLLLYLEGLAGLELSIPDATLTIRDAMPAEWDWMEIRLPIQLAGQKETHWPTVRYDRVRGAGDTKKSIHVTNCPLRTVILPWADDQQVLQRSETPTSITLRLKNDVSGK